MRGMAGKLLIAITLMAGTLYVASPFWSAWSIREAIKSGDVAVLRDKIDWDSVRPALRASIARHAKLLPAAVDAGRAIRPTIWQRIKTLFGETMLDRFMSQYITAEGLPKLYQLKTGYRTRVRGLEDESLLPFRDRVARFLRRVKRAEFMSLSEVEIEVADRDEPQRHIVGTMTLSGLQWKLTKLRVKSVAGTPPAGFDEAGQLADDVRHGRITAKEGTGV